MHLRVITSRPLKWSSFPQQGRIIYNNQKHGLSCLKCEEQLPYLESNFSYQFHVNIYPCLPVVWSAKYKHRKTGSDAGFLQVPVLQLVGKLEI